MCNVFSGLIVTKKGKDWGKVLFLSGVHHEKDREKIKDKYGDEVLAWESVNPYSLTDFKFTHELNVSEKEQKELMKLIKKWAKKQNKEKLLRSMITVIKDNKPTEDYLIQENMIKVGNDMSLVCDFKVNVEGGYGSNLTGGIGSNLTGGFKSNLTGGNWSNLTCGIESNLTGGNWSNLTCGDGCTCIINGDTAYIVLDGKDVILRQIYWKGNKRISKIIDINKLFKKYKKGDKIKIEEGKVVGKVEE
jgi:hypothetical protein